MAVNSNEKIMNEAKNSGEKWTWERWAERSTRANRNKEEGKGLFWKER